MIMEAIFGGDMYPLENIVPQQDGYKAEVKAIADLMDELANRFSKADFSKVEELCGNHGPCGRLPMLLQGSPG